MNNETQAVMYLRVNPTISSRAEHVMEDEALQLADLMEARVVATYKDHTDIGVQTNLERAIAEASKYPSTSILTYDLSTLAPSERKAMALVADLRDRGIEVNFVDEDSIMKVIYEGV